MDAFPNDFNSTNLQKRKEENEEEYRIRQLTLLKTARSELYKKYRTTTTNTNISFDFNSIKSGSLNKENKKKFLLELMERFESIEYGVIIDDEYYYSVDKSTLRVLTKNELENDDSIYKPNTAFIIKK